MLKMLGALLLIGGTSAWGFLGVARLRRRCRILSELESAVAAIRGELVTRLTPVSELVAHAAEGCGEPVGSFLRRVEERLDGIGENSFYEIWSGAIEAADLPLLPDELSALREVPRALGRYDVEEQRVCLVQIESRLEQFRVRAEQKRERDSRIRGAMGVAAGVFTVLLLI